MTLRALISHPYPEAAAAAAAPPVPITKHQACRVIVARVVAFAARTGRLADWPLVPSPLFKDAESIRVQCSGFIFINFIHFQIKL